MKLWKFTVPASGEITAEIEANTEEEARIILKSNNWEFLDEYCFNPKVEEANLIASFDSKD